jgi:catechol 2,3-dioxygenase-like lactoylglutathione lyase family enzyme
LGFEIMPRPDLPFPGYWLGVGGKVQIHMGPDAIPAASVIYLGTTANSARDNSGVVDHIAFHAAAPEELGRRLHELGLSYRTRQFPGIPLFQIFVADPDGLMIELNFPGVATEPSWAGKP